MVRSNTMKKLIVVSVFLFTAVFAFSQGHDPAIIQFSGITNNADNVKAIVPYVTVVNVTHHKTVYISDYQGYFSFPANEQDSLKFSCVGYKTVTLVVPINIASKSYLARVSLKPEIVNLPVFHVFPWATTEEFRKDFISMRLADDDLEIAMKNASKASLLALSRTLPRDGAEINSFQSFNDNVVNAHLLPINNLLNPFSWASLIKEISDGDKSRSADSNNNNYSLQN